MFEEPVRDPEPDESTAVDPPNNTEDGALLSPQESDALPVDPPNNT